MRPSRYCTAHSFCMPNTTVYSVSRRFICVSTLAHEFTGCYVKKRKVKCAHRDEEGVSNMDVVKGEGTPLMTWRLRIAIQIYLPFTPLYLLSLGYMKFNPLETSVL